MSEPSSCDLRRPASMSHAGSCDLFRLSGAAAMYDSCTDHLPRSSSLPESGACDLPELSGTAGMSTVHNAGTAKSHMPFFVDVLCVDREMLSGTPSRTEF